MRTRFFVCCVVLAASCPSAATAQSVAGSQSVSPPRFAVSGAIGVGRPTEQAVTDVYGSALMPVAGQIEVRLVSAVSAFGGVTWMRSDGQTVVVGVAVADERYPTSLTMTSYRIGALAAAHVSARWSIGAGGGVCITSYGEDWPAAGLTASGHTTGFVVFGEGRYHATGRWSALARVEYLHAPATSAATATDVNLGGVHILGGLRFSF